MTWHPNTLCYNSYNAQHQLKHPLSYKQTAGPQVESCHPVRMNCNRRFNGTNSRGHDFGGRPPPTDIHSFFNHYVIWIADCSLHLRAFDFSPNSRGEPREFGRGDCRGAALIWGNLVENWKLVRVRSEVAWRVVLWGELQPHIRRSREDCVVDRAYWMLHRVLDVLMFNCMLALWCIRLSVHQNVPQWILKLPF